MTGISIKAMQAIPRSLARLLIAGLCAVVFLADLLIPTGIAVVALYIIPAFLAAWRLPIWEAVFATFGCAILILLGAYLSPADGTFWVIVVNRSLSFAALWAALAIFLQQRQAGANLATSENQLASFVQSAMDAIISVDADQRIVLFNPAAEKMFRCPAAEALGQSLDRFIPERFRTAHREHIRHFGQTNVTSRRMGQLGRIMGRRTGEEEFPLEAAISQVEVGGKKLYSVILRDITLQIQAEKLAASQKTILEMMAVGITPLSDILSQICLSVEAQSSGTFCAVFLLEGSRLRLGAAPHLPEAYSQALDGLEIGPAAGCCGTAAYRQEPVIVTDLTTDPLGGNCGELAKAYGFRACWSLPLLPQQGAGDVLGAFAAYCQEPRGPEVRVLKFIETVTSLASIAIESRRSQEQLHRAERLAEVGTLASGMAHEIGTPMNVILGRAEYLLQRTAEEPTRYGLVTIIAQVERITKIMNQLLSFSRRRTTERKPMDLKKTVDDCLDIVQEQLKRNRVEVETTYAGSLPLVHADPGQMSQVLLNLVLNAIQAMPEGGKLSLALKPEGASKVKLTVSDTGRGIPKDNLDKIFSPFFTTKEVGKGTGLGLTIVQGIVQDHGGTINVESIPGQGTVFNIAFTDPTAPHPE